MLLITRADEYSTTQIFASLGLLSLPHLHANPTGTTGPARILHISPRLPPLASPLPPQSIKMWRLAPTTPPCVLPVPFLSIDRRLAWQNRVHLPGFSRRSRHLYVSSKMQTALIFFGEYPLNFPFSSAILIGGTGYLYYRSSLLGILKQQGTALDVSYLTQWADVLGVRDLLKQALVEAGLRQP